jgi:hypothetical protein
MAFAQLTYRESLRDIQACLRATQSKLYHLGIRGKVSRNTLAHANQVRDWRIYADFAQILITKARKLYVNDSIGVELDQTVYALDSTTIDLCLSLFPWARFRKRKAAVKLHTLLDVRGSIPSVVIITPGKVHDVRILDRLVLEPGAFYVVDRGYIDFARLYRMHQAGAFGTAWQRTTFASDGFTPKIQSRNPSDAIRSSSLTIFMQKKLFLPRYGVSDISMPPPKNSSSF